MIGPGVLTRRSLVVVAAAAVLGVAACSAGPGEPTQSTAPPSSPSSTAPSTAPSTASSTMGGSPSPSTTTSAPSTTDTPTELGPTLRELGFENGPLDEFSVPSGAVISTSVDQPNVVTIVLSRPSPETVEEYLRTTLPDEGFTIDARGGAGRGAMTFQGNGWTGGFTGTAATSAIVLRPA